MRLSSRHWTTLARRTGLGLVLAVSATVSAHAAPVDAVPLERPGAHMVTSPEATSPDDAAIPDMPSSTITGIAPPEPALPSAPNETDTPKLGAPALVPAEPAILRIAFQPDDPAPTDQSLAQIKSFANVFKQRGGRVTLKAYAGALGDVSTNARRLSLKRVLAVRDLLLAQGISPERLNVRALGGARDAGPLDRVDIVRAGG